MNLLRFVVVLAIWIVSLCFHEYAHARVAFAGGDHTVRDKGYLSLNPLRYINPMMSIVLPLVVLLLGGIGLPGGAVWIETWRLRSRAWMSAVSLAGPAANVAMCAALGLPFLLARPADIDTESGIWPILAISAFLQATAALLNLLPVPGLDGYGALAPWLPPAVDRELRPYARFAMFIMLILFMAFPTFSNGFQRVCVGACAAFGVPRSSIGVGYGALNALHLHG